MEYIITLSNDNTNDLLIALNYTIDKYDLYKKEEFVSALKLIKSNIIDQLHKQMYKKGK